MNNNDNNKTLNLSGKYFYGLGRRKSAIAKVRIYPGDGKFLINQKLIVNDNYLNDVIQPLKITGKDKKFNATILVYGGGKINQKDAIRLGIARALLKFNINLRPTLKKDGFLRRDPRVKERKKPGLKRARRAPQWQKR